jgi:hypothetical protein
MERSEEKRAIMGDIECEETAFSMQDCQDEILRIPGVAGVYGDNFGGHMDITDRPVVSLYKEIGGKVKTRIKGTPLEGEIKAEVERIFGCPEYRWVDIEKPVKTRLKDPNKPMNNQSTLFNYAKYAPHND